MLLLGRSMKTIFRSFTNNRFSTLSYEILEPGVKDLNNKTVLIMHGILGSKMNWRTFSKKVARAHPTWRVVLLDHRAHGDSPSFSHPHNLASCANDVIETMNHLSIAPDVVCGHSFGGKVALAYLAELVQHKQTKVRIPSHTWVFDALPGTADNDYKHRKDTFDSLEAVLPQLQKVTVPIRSKEAMVEQLKGNGISEGVALWMTTNLRLATDPESSSDDYYEWKLDLSVVDKMFESFLATDYWPLLNSKLPNGANIHFVRAEKNKLWTANVQDKFAQLRKNDQVKLHLLEKSDHWVHVDNPVSLLEVVSQTLGNKNC